MLPWLLRRANQRYRATIRAHLAASGVEGLPQPGYWAIRILADGATDASQLVREMGITKQAVSKLVDSLVAAGFVERRPNATDRRRTDLLLTARGREVTEIIVGAVRQTDEAFVAEVGAQRFADLQATLGQLARPSPE